MTSCWAESRVGRILTGSHGSRITPSKSQLGAGNASPAFVEPMEVDSVDFVAGVAGAAFLKGKVLILWQWLIWDWNWRCERTHTT